MSATGSEPSGDLVTWVTLVAADTRTTGAPGPAPDPLVARWRGAPVTVVTGEQDRFFPPGRLAPVAKARLDADLVVMPGVGHLSIEERPRSVADVACAAAEGMVG